MTQRPIIDLNCDMGEIPTLDEDGTQAALLQVVSSVNVSCGAHAGNERLIQRTIAAAQQAGVSVGAHPSYPDFANFGRTIVPMSPDELRRSVVAQLQWLDARVRRMETVLRHVKPHGALYNEAARNSEVAHALATAVRMFDSSLPVYGLAESTALGVLERESLVAVPEAFCDRAYEADGTLRHRSLPGALITDPDQAADQAVVLASRRSARTLCIHSDTPNAVAIAGAVRAALMQAGFLIAPVQPT